MCESVIFDLWQKEGMLVICNRERWITELQSGKRDRLDYRYLVKHVLFLEDQRVAIRSFSELFIRFVIPLTG
jgi:hypothetical protein